MVGSLVLVSLGTMFCADTERPDWGEDVLEICSSSVIVQVIPGWMEQTSSLFSLDDFLKKLLVTVEIDLSTEGFFFRRSFLRIAGMVSVAYCRFRKLLCEQEKQEIEESDAQEIAKKIL